jgi:hypothetical protein
MIEYNLDTEHSILHVQPKPAIEQDDFVKLAKRRSIRQRTWLNRSLGPCLHGRLQTWRSQ